jgi:hypothetical protein
MKAQPETFKLRKSLAEDSFEPSSSGGVKSRITLAYNLKRVLNLISFEKLMAAVA